MPTPPAVLPVPVVVPPVAPPVVVVVDVVCVTVVVAAFGSAVVAPPDPVALLAPTAAPPPIAVVGAAEPSAFGLEGSVPGGSSVIRSPPVASAGISRIQPGRISEASVSFCPSGCTRSLLSA